LHNDDRSEIGSAEELQVFFERVFGESCHENRDILFFTSVELADGDDFRETGIGALTVDFIEGTDHHKNGNAISIKSCVLFSIVGVFFIDGLLRGIDRRITDLRNQF